MYEKKKKPTNVGPACYDPNHNHVLGKAAKYSIPPEHRSLKNIENINSASIDVFSEDMNKPKSNSRLSPSSGDCSPKSDKKDAKRKVNIKMPRQLLL